MSTALPKRVQVSPQALYRRLEQDGVILNLTDENYYGLSDVGARVWELVAENNDPEAIVTTLLTEYDVSEETLRADLARLLDAMARAGLLTIEP